MIVPLTKPFLDRNEEEAVVKVLRSGWHTQGPQVEILEKEFCAYTKVKHAVAVSSCTTGLYLSLLIAGIGKHDEVLVPSFTFIATVNVIVQAGAVPVFVEVDRNSLNIDPNQLEKKITQKTKSIIVVDQVGNPCDLDRVKKIARKHGLFIIQDAACSLGSLYKNKRIGGLADVTCFSFHPRKVISSGEGGMITTNIKSIAQQAKILRTHGASISDYKRHNTIKITAESYSVAGFNYRLTDIQAAIVIAQMKKLPSIIKKRTYLANRYTNFLASIRSIRTPYTPSYAIPNWQSYIITLLPGASLLQEELMQKLLDRGIVTRRGVMACHLEPYYKNSIRNCSLPITEMLTKNTVTLPLFPELTVKQQDYVIGSLKLLLK